MSKLKAIFLTVVLAICATLSLSGCSKLTKLVIINFKETSVMIILDGHKRTEAIASASFVRDRVYLGDSLAVTAKDLSGKVVFKQSFSSSEVQEVEERDGEFIILIK